MPSYQEKQKALKRVLNSKEFANSDLSKRLLEYLVEVSENDSAPKETTIAIEVFGRQEDYDPSTDAYVRSFIYKVRKKLEHYYEHEGRDDKIRIVIPKGQYHVEFQKNHGDRASKAALSRLKRYQLATAALATALVLLAAFFLSRSLWKQNSARQLADTPVWYELFHGKKPVMMVTGDVFAFLEYRKDLNSWRLVEEPYVVDSKAFERYKARFPKENVYVSSYSMLPRNIIDALMALVPIFHENQKPLSHKLASRLLWDDINNYSIVYVGGTSGLYLLRNIITLTHFRFRPVNKYFIIDAKKDTVMHFFYKDPGTASDEYRDEYAYVAKVPGPQNNVIYFFIGMDYNSRVYSLRKMLDFEFLDQLQQEFTQKYGHFPKYFEVLWKVGGYKEAAYLHKIVYFSSLEKVSPPQP